MQQKNVVATELKELKFSTDIINLLEEYNNPEYVVRFDLYYDTSAFGHSMRNELSEKTCSTVVTIITLSELNLIQRYFKFIANENDSISVFEYQHFTTHSLKDMLIMSDSKEVEIFKKSPFLDKNSKRAKISNQGDVIDKLISSVRENYEEYFISYDNPENKEENWCNGMFSLIMELFEENPLIAVWMKENRSDIIYDIRNNHLPFNTSYMSVYDSNKINWLMDWLSKITIIKGITKFDYDSKKMETLRAKFAEGRSELSVMMSKLEPEFVESLFE